MLSLLVHETMAETYLEQQYHTAPILLWTLTSENKFKAMPLIISNLVPLTQARLFYFNDNKQQAYHHLKI